MTTRTKPGQKYKHGYFVFHVPTGRAMGLRERVLYARLLPLPSPVSILGLARLTGGLMDRQTVTDTLARLERHGLVVRTRVGRRDRWRAVREVPPAAEHLVRRGKDGRMLYWSLALPVDNPWGGKGSLERWVALAFYRHLARQGRRWKSAHMARVLDLDARTLGDNLVRLRAEGYLDGDIPVPLQGGRAKQSSCATAAKNAHDVDLGDEIKKKAAGLGYTAAELRKATRDAARTHAAMLQKGKYRGGSALKCLNARLDRELADRVTASNEVRRVEQELQDAGLRESVERAARLEALQKQDERESRAVNRIQRTLPLTAKWKLPRRTELVERYGVEALERAADALESAGVSFQWNLSVEQIVAVIHRPSTAADLTPPTAKPLPNARAEPMAADEDDDMSVFEGIFTEPVVQASEAVAPVTAAPLNAHGAVATPYTFRPILLDHPEMEADLATAFAGCEFDDDDAD